MRVLLIASVLLVAIAVTSVDAIAQPARASKVQLRKALKQAERAKRRANQAAAAARRAQAAAQQALAAAQAAAGAGIPDGAVTTPKLADGAVTTPKLGPFAVTAPTIGPGAVTAGKLGTGAINSSSLFSPGVLDSSTLFGTGVIDASALGAGAVGTPAIGVIPAARVSVTTNQLIPDDFNTFTPLTWNQEIFDTDGLHAGASPNLSAPVAGIYQVTSSVELNNAAAGDEDTTFWALLADGLNAVAQTQSFTSESNGGETNWNPIDLNLTTLVSLDAGDTVHVEVSQFSQQPGGPVSLPIDSGDAQSSFQMAWVGPQTVAP